MSDFTSRMMEHDAEMVMRDAFNLIYDRTDAALVHLSAVKAMVAWLDQQATICAHTARIEGASWSQVGAQLGISKQAAQQRFGQQS